jgi:hypothetical protein
VHATPPWIQPPRPHGRIPVDGDRAGDGLNASLLREIGRALVRKGGGGIGIRS